MTENIGSETQASTELPENRMVASGWRVMTDGDKIALVMSSTTANPVIVLMDLANARGIAQQINKLCDMVERA